MNTAKWTNNPAWNALSSEKKRVLQNLMEQTEGLPLHQALPYLIQTQKSMQQEGLHFSKTETDLLLQLFSTSLSPKEKATFETLRSFMKPI